MNSTRLKASRRLAQPLATRLVQRLVGAAEGAKDEGPSLSLDFAAQIYKVKS